MSKIDEIINFLTNNLNITISNKEIDLIINKFYPDIKDKIYWSIDIEERLAAPAPAARRRRGGCGTRGPGATGRVHPTSFAKLYPGIEPMAELRIWRRSC